MSHWLDADENARIRQLILAQCTWSETYSSLKHLLNRLSNQLPLIVQFGGDNEQHRDVPIDTDDSQTMFFFDREVSNKITLTPLKQTEDRPDQFQIYPRHCTFAITNVYKGIFEFVFNGQRCTRIYQTLEQMIRVTSTVPGMTTFMARNRVLCYFVDERLSKWVSKEYIPGSIFNLQRVHRSSVSTTGGQQVDNDHLECLDEQGYIVFLKLNSPGRFSLIATSSEQLNNQPELFLHSTQMTNIDQFIRRVTLDSNDSTNCCIRLVRGDVPNNFACQHFRLIRQHTHDVLVGLTRQGLIVEFNLESHTPCRYATNLPDILGAMYGSPEEQALEAYVDRARAHYRNNFQASIQLVSTRDWSAFVEYWKWIRDDKRNENENHRVAYQSRHRFHIVASTQDLSDHARSLSALFFRHTRHHHHHHHRQQISSPRINARTPRITNGTKEQKALTAKQRTFFSHISNTVRTKRRTNRVSAPNPPVPSLLLSGDSKPFDNSNYDSNQHHRTSPLIHSLNQAMQTARI